MISDAAVKRLARARGVDPVVVDRDYALGVVLVALAFSGVVADDWVFKGGTCLKKMYFGDYRFSEDLDFTSTSGVSAASALETVEAIQEYASAAGVALAVDQTRIEQLDDEYGRESIEVRLPYQGALRMGSRPAIQFHVSADERVMLQPELRAILHEYDDADQLEGSLPCYQLEEVLAEKLRAVGGQRRFAVARDVYDIGELVRRGADVDVALGILPAKAAYKGVDLSSAHHVFVGRQDEFRASWERTLSYLVPGSADFDAAWGTTATLLGRVSKISDGG